MKVNAPNPKQNSSRAYLFNLYFKKWYSQLINNKIAHAVRIWGFKYKVVDCDYFFTEKTFKRFIYSLSVETIASKFEKCQLIKDEVK